MSMRRSRQFQRACIVVGLTLLMAGCLGTGERRGADAFWPGAIAANSVEVVNQGWTEMAIYLSQGSGRYRVGSVGGTSRERIRLPQGLTAGGAGIVLVAAEPGGGAEVWSPAFELHPDTSVTWTIGEGSGRSHLSVR